MDDVLQVQVRHAPGNVYEAHQHSPEVRLPRPAVEEFSSLDTLGQ